MSLLSMGAIAVSAVVIGSVVMPVMADHWKDSGDEAQNLVSATKTTARKANELGASFGRVVSVQAEDAGLAAADDGAQPDGGATLHQDPYGGPNDRAVATALAELASVGATPAVTGGDERVIAIENLRDAWTPRYRQAEEELRRLALRIEHADRAADRYFDAQSSLTRGISNTEGRLRAERADRKEREIYRQWREQAGRILAQADRIMTELRDMDLRISKQLLSANFASVYGDFLEMPTAISDLHRELEDFRSRSGEISAALGGH